MLTPANALFVGLLCAAPASGAFVGGGFVLDTDGSAAATAVLGAPTTVHQLYIAFNEADDILNSIGNANFNTRVPGTSFVHNGLFGANPDFDGDVNAAAFGTFPETEWDTYVGIGGPLFGADSNATGDTDFAFTSNGVTGGWFDIPGDDGMGGVTRTGLAGDGIMEGGLFLVWAGQFVVQGAGVIDAEGRGFIGDGFIAPGGLFEGAFDVNWIDAIGGPNNAAHAFIPPAPGTAALFGIAGVTASRRRRG